MALAVSTGFGVQNPESHYKYLNTSVLLWWQCIQHTVQTVKQDVFPCLKLRRLSSGTSDGWFRM